MSSVLTIVLCVLVTVIGQVALRYGLLQIGELTLKSGNLLSEAGKILSNIYVLIGLFMGVLFGVFWLAVVSRIPLGVANSFIASSYVIILFVSWLVFKEAITPVKLVGIALISIGVYLVSMSTAK